MCEYLLKLSGEPREFMYWNNMFFKKKDDILNYLHKIDTFLMTLLSPLYPYPLSQANNS